MLVAALLAVVIAANASDSAVSPKTPIQQCFETMDGAVYHGDPTDRPLMKAGVAACERGIAQLRGMRPTSAQGPEKLFLTGRIMDRAAVLSYMGLNDCATALREVKAANLYFRIAAGLPKQSENYHAAALINVALTNLQLKTLRTDIAASAAPRIAHRQHRARAVYTAYHKL